MKIEGIGETREFVSDGGWAEPGGKTPERSHAGSANRFEPSTHL